jgi:hypothetical protein
MVEISLRRSMQKPSYLELPVRLLWVRCITYGVSYSNTSYSVKRGRALRPYRHNTSEESEDAKKRRKGIPVNKEKVLSK